MSFFVISLLAGFNIALIYLLLAAPIGIRTVSVTRPISADRADLWNALYPLGNNAGWDGQILGTFPLGQNSAEIVLSWTGRDDKPIRRQIELSDVVAETSYTQRVVEDSSLEQSFWKDYSQSAMLDGPDGEVLVRMATTDRYKGLAFAIFRYFSLRRSLNRLKLWAETGKLKTGGVFERPVTQFGFAALSALLIWPLFGLNARGFAMAILMTTVVALHELGHMAAFRLMGHKTVRMIFIPILGGIAIGGRPYDRRFEIAFVALMGAGFSAFLLFPAVAGWNWANANGYHGAGLLFAVFAGMCAVFNLANLIPVWRFDGGQVLRQMFHTKLQQTTVSFLLFAVILGVGVLAGVPVNMVIAAGVVFAILSIVTAGKSVKPRHEMKPMTSNEWALLAAGLCAVIVIHGMGMVWAVDVVLS